MHDSTRPDLIGSGGTVRAQRREARRNRRNHRHVILATETILALLLIWQALSAFRVLDTVVVSKPTDVGLALWSLVRMGSFWAALRSTLLLTFVGYLLALVIGGVLGTLLGLFSLLEKAVAPYILALRSLPVSLAAPLFIAWFGFGYKSKLATAVSLGFFPVMVNTMVGLRQMNSASLALMLSLRASHRQIFWKVQLPSALPFIFVGVKHSLLLAFSGVLLAEILIGGSTEGLGTLVREYMTFIRMDFVFAVTAVAVSILVVFVVVFDRMEHRIVFWAEDTNHLRSGMRQ